uniref:[heparan sulfate]-glucosamine N-sulfotransferase n=1 Tax=Cacopsylla melanoneura TaxID=428564 RepID=A0A8D9AFM7_9HEMI
MMDKQSLLPQNFLMIVTKTTIIRKFHNYSCRPRRLQRFIKKEITAKHCVAFLAALSVLSILYYMNYLSSPFASLMRRRRPEPFMSCAILENIYLVPSNAHNHTSVAKVRIDPRVLVFVETAFSRLGREIAELLVYNRMRYKLEVSGKSLPVMTNQDKGKYGVIVFENVNKYLEMDKWNRELLDKYCREYSVGIVAFFPPSETAKIDEPVRGFPLTRHSNMRLKDAGLNPLSPILRLTRAGETAWGELPGTDWNVFITNHSTYETLEYASNASTSSSEETRNQTVYSTVVQDHGTLDGIERVFFGSGLRFWLHRLLFLDSLSYLSHGQLSLSLNRTFLIDIDDIFVGEIGTRLLPDDVRALLRTQKRIQKLVRGFKFNLGFSGKYFHHGEPEENAGDDLLTENAHEFSWFSHMWNHQQPHLYENQTQLEVDMMLNKNFAKTHNIPVDSGYSIAPHHSGVYPVHENLYTAWRHIWKVKVTSTEEYPHLRPARLRRGFKHRGISVLPRQTCGLFTHTIFIERYPGGRQKLDESIQGGELFQTFVFNPINIFMSHMGNYGNDRLALYTFESVIKFLTGWTNLHLSSAPPIKIAEKYFQLYPEEQEPIWGNPCLDSRHVKIWSHNKSCEQLPRFLVIGPQKTGTTALYTFLSLHPNISSNSPSPDTFEEIQFFNGRNYYRGLDWYMDFFPLAKNSTPQYLFEKSATYFDGDLVPKRVQALLPQVKLVTILISPIKRAYSWYQHTKSHGDQLALNHTFYDIITANESAPKPIKDLRNRCLNPGKYAQHLERWLIHFPPQQLHIIDGDQLKSNPIDVMDSLQKFLKITPVFDYSSHLRYEPKKGFFCQVVNTDQTKCLGRSKGRKYPRMDLRSYRFLQRHYLSYNTALVKLLKKLGTRTFPQWLKDDLSNTLPT